MTEPATGPNTEFVQAITLTDPTMLVAGSMIGSGIFITSAAMARSIGSPMWLLIAWVLTGVCCTEAANAIQLGLSGGGAVTLEAHRPRAVAIVA